MKVSVTSCSLEPARQVNPDVRRLQKMGILKGKTEGGSGGKRGHSNMDHWVTTEEIKTASRKRRRLEAKKRIVSELASELEEAQRKGKARRDK
jgi:hypothetical protein